MSKVKSSSGARGRSEHHLRPTSRGGAPKSRNSENVRAIDDAGRHVPYHTLFSNLWPHEAALLLFFSWSTQYVPDNRDRYGKEGFLHQQRAWNKLFGKTDNPQDAIAILRKEFVKSKETRQWMADANSLCAYAIERAIAPVQGIGPSCEASSVWLDHAGYYRLFGKLSPHEAILVTFLSWGTFCPFQELKLPYTFLGGDGGPQKETFKQRIEVWDELFGKTAEPRDVIFIIEKKFVPRNDERTKELVRHAKRVCREMKDCPHLRN